MAGFILGILPYLGMLLTIVGLVLLIPRILRCIADDPEPVVAIDKEGDPVFLDVHGDKGLHYLLIGAALLVYAFLGNAAWAAWDILLLSLGGLNFNLGFLFALPVLGHILFSIKNVPEDKVGGLYFFGHALKNADSGLHFAPFMRLEIGPKDVQKIWAPGKRDQIFWGDEKEDLPEGMVRPIFMNTRAPAEGETKPLDVQMTVGLGYALFWRISNFLTFNAHTRSIPETDDQLRSISEAVLAEDIASRTVDGAITGQAAINKNFDNKIRERTEGWGVQVMRANLTIINPSHKLAEKMRDRATAQFDADAQVIAAQATATSTVLIGEADGKAARARAFGPLQGRAEGLAAIKDKLEVSDGEKVHEKETLRDALSNGRATFVGGRAGLADLLGMFDTGKSLPSEGGEKP